MKIKHDLCLNKDVDHSETLCPSDSGRVLLPSPKATMYVVTYNQENFVKEAVCAALKQDYTNLEIIISDDASTDGTWEIIRRIVSDYHGQHHIVLNCNKQNMGVCAHINKVASMATGEAIICSAGDDISRSDRVRKIMDVFVKEPECQLVYSDIDRIDEAGHLLDIPLKKRQRVIPTAKAIASGKAVVSGSCIACRKELFNFFGANLPTPALYEDIILAFRASLIGKIVKIPEPLVSYRSSESSLTNFCRTKAKETDMEKYLMSKNSIGKNLIKVYNGCLTDLTRYELAYPEKAIEVKMLQKCLLQLIEKKRQGIWIISLTPKKALKLKLNSPFTGISLRKFLLKLLKQRKRPL